MKEEERERKWLERGKEGEGREIGGERRRGVRKGREEIGEVWRP